MRLSLFFFLLALCLFAVSQSQVKYKLETIDGYFYAYATPANPKGMLILITDFNQTEEDLLAKTEIAQLAYIHGIVTIIVPCGKKVFADREMVKVLTEVATKSLKAYELVPTQVVLGGYGTGGTIALKYTEYCLKFKNDYPITPKAIYTVESAVDITEAYRSYDRTIAKNLNHEAVLEARIFKNIMDVSIGGGPDQEQFMYTSLTPFDRLDSKNENIKALSRTPTRLYNDTDVMWHMKNKQMSAYDMPAIPASEMIIQLNLLGNRHAELIKTNVDSKSITEKKINARTSVDEKELIVWMLKHLGIGS